MIDFGHDINDGYGYHRHGWAWVVRELADRLHDPASSLMLLSFVEKRLLFQGSNSSYYPIQRPTKPWIGIFHLPPSVPLIFSRTHQLQRLIDEPYLRDVMTGCVGTICLSTYLQAHLKTKIASTCPSTTFLHPAPYDIEQFNIVSFIDNLSSTSRFKVVQLGFWLRKHHVIHRLATALGSRIIPFQVGINTAAQRRSWELELALTDTRPSIDVCMTHRLTNSQYDSLLTSSIVLLPLYDTSANNSLIECMTRCTPVLIERHPSVEEYLGVDYPMYYSCFDELVDILTGPSLESLVGKAYEYLKLLAVKETLSINKASDRLSSFLDSIL